ncbi:MAG TPA: division/cell wall cluster transcriptional repressor MraZ, partial [Planctomycetota bacterium]|nr:division/cell wall cluster transcriptional repressor MraZ [Planctomycetota bacterium]
MGKSGKQWSRRMPAAIDFIGRYDHTLDAKNRLMIPQAYRDAVKRAERSLRFFLTRGLDECLAMYAKSTWSRMVDLLNSHKSDELAERKIRKFYRTFYSSAVEVTPDKAGRIVIPEHLRKLAGVERKVVLIGVNDRIEIWDAEKWARFAEGQEGE